MDILFALFFLLLPLVVRSVGIFGGESVKSPAPFFVLVRTRRKSVCGGSIVSSDTVLTAAHCLYDFKESSWFPTQGVQVIKTDFRHAQGTQPVAWFTCKHYLPHENFDPRTRFSPYDIALVKLNECFDLRDPQNGVIEPCGSIAPEEHVEAWAMGVGLVRTDPDMAPIVLQGVLLYRFAPCANIYAHLRATIDDEKQFCYGSPNIVPSGTGMGDSGGPIVSYTTGAERQCLVGVASISSVSSNSMMPSIFIRADYFSKWIKESINSMSSTPHRSKWCSIL